MQLENFVYSTKLTSKGQPKAVPGGDVARQPIKIYESTTDEVQAQQVSPVLHSQSV